MQSLRAECEKYETRVTEAILEIADANNIPRDDAGKKFFEDIEEHYDYKLALESKKHGLQKEVNNLSQQKLKLLADTSAIPNLGAAVVKLFGIDGNNSVEEFELLVNKVDMAGGIRAAIEKLGTQSKDDNAPILSAYDGNKNRSTGEIKKEKEVLTGDDDSLFKRLINQVIDQLGPPDDDPQRP